MELLLPPPTADLLDLDQLSTLEETAYKKGFADGQVHGNLHGLFEGRELGTLKGFEVWEEIGFIQGTARFWHQAIATSSSAKSRKQVKQIQQLESLLELIDTVPIANGKEVDLFGMIERIRAKYKMVCSSLAIPPSTNHAPNEQSNNGTPTFSKNSRLVKIHGRNVDANQLNF